MYWKVWRQIFKSQWRNPWFYVYCACFIVPVIVFDREGRGVHALPWYGWLILVGQMPFVHPFAVLVENKHLLQQESEPEPVDRCQCNGTAGGDSEVDSDRVGERPTSVR